MRMSKPDDIALILERFGRVFQNDAHVAGLKPTQWEALRYLARANRFSRNPKALTAYLGMTKGTVSQTIIALERKKLIRKKTGPKDKRSVQLELTSAGRLLLEKDPISAIRNTAIKLKKTDRDALTDGLKQLLRVTLDERNGVPFGVCKTCRYFRAHAEGGDPHRCALLDVSLSDEDSELHCIENEAA